MTLEGTVVNGIIVLESGTRLPESVRVRVELEDDTMLTPLTAGSKGHGIMDIPYVSVGSVLIPFTAEDDLLDEMLQDRS
jgi:hypothetical protein